MEIMLSVNPPYTDMIFSGYKPYEFRRRILKELDEGYPTEDIKAYIYETKNQGGAGKVIGEVSIGGSYGLHYGDEKGIGTEWVQERFQFIKSLYLDWCTLKGINPNMNEGWFKSTRFSAYQREIGLRDENSALRCNYALILVGPVRYAEGHPLEEYSSLQGIPLRVPPQNMFRVICRYAKPSGDGHKRPIPKAKLSTGGKKL